MAKLKIPAIQMWDLLSGLQNGTENVLRDDVTTILQADSLYGLLNNLLNNYRSGILTTDTIQILQTTLREMEKQEKPKTRRRK
jgi:hypothetical protein